MWYLTCILHDLEECTLTQRHPSPDFLGEGGRSRGLVGNFEVSRGDIFCHDGIVSASDLNQIGLALGGGGGIGIELRDTFLGNPEKIFVDELK